MHRSYFFGRIYVEKIFEQCCLGYRNSQKAKGVSDGTGTLVKAQIRDGNLNSIRGYPIRPDPNGPDFTQSDIE